jgi:hypothetical protein
MCGAIVTFTVDGRTARNVLPMVASDLHGNSVRPGQFVTDDPNPNVYP